MKPLNEVMEERAGTSWKIVKKNGNDVWVEYTPRNAFFLVKAITRFTAHQSTDSKLYVVDEKGTTYHGELYLGKERKVALRFSAHSLPELLEKIAFFLRTSGDVEVVS